MNIALTTLTVSAPLAGVPVKPRQKSHRPDYRRAYVARMIARQQRHGSLGMRAKGKIIQTIGYMSQSEVAQVLGISREAVRQTENRALAKLRAALLPLYRELSH